MCEPVFRVSEIEGGFATSHRAKPTEVGGRSEAKNDDKGLKTNVIQSTEHYPLRGRVRGWALFGRLEMSSSAVQ